MKKRSLLVLIVVCLSVLIAFGQSNRKNASSAPTPSDEPTWDSAFDTVKWVKGPNLGALGTTAQVKVPEGYVFAGADDTRTIMVANQNLVSGQELGFVAPAGESWFAVFEFNPVGYVKDDDKNSLDADAMLEQMKKHSVESNKERERRGWPTMTIIGWETPPRYDELTNNLEWALRAESDGHSVVNYNTRLLGRGGVMEVTLVTDPELLAETLPKFKAMLSGFDFVQGQKYSEFRPGDKMAAYGLTGLIVGGGTAALVKSGAFKWIWKALVAAVVGVGALLKKIFSREKTA